jgi:hypothetical protein
MLPDFRFVIGAILATAVLGVAAFGAAISVQLAFQAKIGPVETPRALAFADHSEWNQFYDADNTRRFEGMLSASISGKTRIAPPPEGDTPAVSLSLSEDSVPADLPAPVTADEPSPTGSIARSASAPAIATDADRVTPAPQVRTAPQAQKPPPPQAKPAARKPAAKKVRVAKKPRKARPRAAAQRSAPSQAQTGFPITDPVAKRQAAQRNGNKDPFGSIFGN